MEVQGEEKKPEIYLSPEEESFYSFVFDRYSTLDTESNTFALTNSSARALFTTSRIPSKELAVIWNIAVDKKKKHMDKSAFNLALKLVAIRQTADTLEGWEEECKKEQPLPKFDKEELQMFQGNVINKMEARSDLGERPSDNSPELHEESKGIVYPQLEKPEDVIRDKTVPEVNDKLEFFNVSISSPEYVKTGWAGLTSYTIYKLETQSNIAGYNPRKVYSSYRRYNDFFWLHSQLQKDEQLIGYVLPQLPSKKLLWNASAEFVEKRREELQLYLSMLGKHPYYKTSKDLRAFLTYEKTEEFEAYKAGRIAGQKDSLVFSGLKNLQFKNTMNLIYSMVKTKFFTQEEPADVQSMTNFDTVLDKLEKYIPLLTMLRRNLEKEIEFKTKYFKAQADLVTTVIEAKELNEDLIKKYYGGYNELLQDQTKYNVKVLNEVKEEIMRLEGVKAAIYERKCYVRGYIGLMDYVNGKKGEPEEVDKVSQEVEALKHKILQINKNLSTELDAFDKNRVNKLQRILGCKVYSEKQKGAITGNFVSSHSKGLPFPESEDNIGEL